jgi:hypothetical protein
MFDYENDYDNDNDMDSETEAASVSCVRLAEDGSNRVASAGGPRA